MKNALSTPGFLCSPFVYNCMDLATTKTSGAFFLVFFPSRSVLSTVLSFTDSPKGF